MTNMYDEEDGVDYNENDTRGDNINTVQDIQNTQKISLSKLEFTTWVSLLAIISMALVLLSVVLFGLGCGVGVFKAFCFLGYGFVIASMTMYVLDLLRTQNIRFTTSFALMILALFASIITTFAVCL